jgi:hypothetical protein
MPFTYRRPDDPREPTTVEFPDSQGYAESLILEDLGDGLYVLEESPLMSEYAAWKDVVRCIPGPDGHLVCTDLIRPAGLHRERFLSSFEFLQSQNWTELQDRIMSAGGNWEQIWQGFIVLSYPPEMAAVVSSLLRPKESDPSP